MGTTKAFIKNPETVRSPLLLAASDSLTPSQLFALEHMRDRYWHNMAGRIQRAFRSYMRYKHECATRIQRFWTSKKTGIVFVQLRDYGHQVLAGRKERRRFSLVSMRRFMGDYLGVAEKGGEGQMLQSAAGIGGELSRRLGVGKRRADVLLACSQEENRLRSAAGSSCSSPSSVGRPSRVLGSSSSFVVRRFTF